MMLNPATTDITLTAFNGTFQAPWVGKLEPEEVGLWIDEFLVLVSAESGVHHTSRHLYDLQIPMTNNVMNTWSHDVVCFSTFFG